MPATSTATWHAMTYRWWSISGPPWCGPCRMMAPTFHQAAIDLEPYARLVKVDTEAEQQLAARFNIRSIPTLAVFKGGREIARQSGALDLGSLKRWLQPHLHQP